MTSAINSAWIMTLTVSQRPPSFDFCEATPKSSPFNRAGSVISVSNLSIRDRRLAGAICRASRPYYARLARQPKREKRRRPSPTVTRPYKQKEAAAWPPPNLSVKAPGFIAGFCRRRL